MLLNLNKMEIAEFVVASEIAFERLMTPTKGLRPAQMEEAMLPEAWSFKDLGGHIAGWNSGLLQRLEALYHGRDPGSYVSPGCLVNESGTIIQLGGTPLKRVMNELRITHSALLEASRRVDWTKMDENGQIPDWLYSGIIDHYDFHRVQVEGWVHKLVAEGRGPLASLPVK
jgi:hypothetical protein